MNKQEYEVHLDLFEGPLDLLLYLVEKSEVSIIDIKVSEIASQYLACIDIMRELNIDVAGEYLKMATILVRLKARELLPDSLPEDDEFSQGEEGSYNREQLIAQLLEYKKYKEAANKLKAFESEQFGTCTRGKAEDVENESQKNDEVILGDISIFDLMSAFRKILERVPLQSDPSHIVEVDSCRIDDHIEHILSTITDRGGEVHFEEFFRNDNRRIVFVVTFMAILELVKMGQISFRQHETFGAIFVSRAYVSKNNTEITVQDSGIDN
ncbi:MAG: segregation/condensation protein A [Chitinispirillales bacterium]|jgi:chromatin segregation and condensation protein Rec8/ScpA/Scc1 (kleisin family)|nr:segregation/condensation protein A [Chitinispirillales bacterium]